MIPDKETRDIQAYLRGTLPKIRREKFELKLQNDPEFRAKVNELRPIFEILEDETTASKIKEIISHHQVDKPENESRTQAIIRSIMPHFKSVFRYGLVACTLLLIGIVWYDSNSSARLYKEYYRPESIGRASSSQGCPNNEVLNLYYQQKYAEFLDKTKSLSPNPCNSYYDGLSYLALNDIDNAKLRLIKAQKSDNNYIKQSAEWYLVLTLVRNSEDKEAVALLEKIISTPEHQYEVAAQELKMKLTTKPLIYRIRF